jgi:hypothetical protein
LWKRKWSGAVLFGIFFTLGFASTQIDNVLFWHKPIYQHLLDYQSYNATHFSDYPSNVFSYLALITYYVFPVVTGIFIYAVLKKKVALQGSSNGALQGVSQGSSKGALQGPAEGASQVICIFLGTVVFIGFHLLFPNRQERFLLPAVPFVLLLMIRAISKHYPCKAPSAGPFEESSPSERPSTGPSALPTLLAPWINRAMRWSIYLSIVYTLGYSFYIPKSKYLEASKALYERGDFQNVVIDNWKGEESVWLPMHYVGKFVHPVSMNKLKSFEELKQQIAHQPFYDATRLPTPRPNYLIIWGKEESYPRAKAYEDAGFRIERLSSANSEDVKGFALYSLNLLD